MESKGYSSLFALVDSHLSQTSLNDDITNGNEDSKEFQSGSVSESLLFTPKQQLPKLPTFSDSPIKGVLTKQVANMLKAKEKVKEVENPTIVEKMNNIYQNYNDDHVIDLMKSLQTPYKGSSSPEESLSKLSSLESLFKINLAKCEEFQEQTDTQPLLPCVIDLTYLIHQNMWRGKCSSFGKVLTSKLRPVAAPYLMDKIESDIICFDFSTKSPCDIHKDNLRKPTCSGRWVSQIM